MTAWIYIYTKYNTSLTETANEILNKVRRIKRPCVTSDNVDLCDVKRDLKTRLYKAEGENEYRDANNRIQTAPKKAKEYG